MSLEPSKTMHANCVAVDGKGLLILGASGSGKSTLTLQLLGLGADLVSDDQTVLISDQYRGQINAQAPVSIHGLIEVRGMGVLAVPALEAVGVTAILDLDEIESKRLPAHHTKRLLGILFPCLHKIESPAFPAALLHYLRYGRQDVE